MAAERAELEALRRANDEAKRVEVEVAPQAAPQPADMFAPKPTAQSLDYERGFNACKSLALAILAESETYKTRPQIIQGITALDAHN